MTDLTTALNLVKLRDNYQAGIELNLRSSLQEYLDFLPERGSTWAPHYKDALEYTFTELDGKNFIFQGEEHYQYGEYDTPHVSLPFEFVESPETFKARVLAEIKAAEDARKARVKVTQEQRVAALRDQLARAEAQLAKSDAPKDPIRTIATRNQEQKLRAELAITQSREVE